jgi:hypothetical protein
LGDVKVFSVSVLETLYKQEAAIEHVPKAGYDIIIILEGLKNNYLHE